MYKVYFYEQKTRKSPVLDFIKACQSPLRTKISKQIKTLQNYGLTENNPYMKKLTGTPLWESRILGRDNTRIICVALIEQKIVILNIFRKKGNKTPVRELELSMKRYKDLTNDI